MKSRGTYIGSFSLKRQAQPREAWVNPVTGAVRRGWMDPKVPEFQRNWTVTFYMPGMAPKFMTAGSKVVRYRICDRCLAEVENPVVTRPRCDCQQRANAWAEAWLETQTVLLQRGELERLAEMRAPKRTASLGDWLDLYLLRGPDDRRARVNALRAMVEEVTGLPLESATWETLTSGLVITWAEMRQEAGRRGWLGLGRGKNMPGDGWEQIRAMRSARLLPPLDTQSVQPWNTTILGYLVQAKTVFGDKVRAYALRELVIPELEDFRAASLPIQTPKGHKAITPGQLMGLLTAADELRRSNVRLWVVNQMLMRLACRPVEVMAARPSWLEVVGGRTRIVIVNRPEEGFELKAGAKATERRIWVPEDLAVGMREVMVEGSLIGARLSRKGKYVTSARQLVEYEHSQWLRSAAGLTGTQTNYILRHLGAAERMTSEGAGAAGALLGHADESLVRSTYGANLATLEALSDAEILRRFEE